MDYEQAACFFTSQRHAEESHHQAPAVVLHGGPEMRDRFRRQGRFAGSSGSDAEPGARTFDGGISDPEAPVEQVPNLEREEAGEDGDEWLPRYNVHLQGRKEQPLWEWRVSGRSSNHIPRQ
jgi:hypothetical protein